MTDNERVDHLIETLGRIESLAVQFSTAMRQAVDDLDGLSKAAYREGGIRGADHVQNALSIDALYGLVRGRLHGLGLEQLLQRTTQGTDLGWVETTATRVRRAV